METITNAASAASRAIWGAPAPQTESGQEPISGQTGNTENGEPYDAGNIEPTETESKAALVDEESGEREEKKVETSTDDFSSNTAPQVDGPGNTASTGPIRPEHETEKTGVTSSHQPASGFSDNKPTSSNDTSGPGAEPSVSVDPASGAQIASEHQGAERPNDEPDNKEGLAIRETKKEAEDAANVDVSSPGPKPLSEVKAGAVSRSTGDDDDGPQKESHGSGTGEQYIKSTGMQADGGDFDASKAGAGKEADRLLEEKGIHHEPGTAGPPNEGDEDKSESGGKSGKLSLKDKIKAKLHKS
jgi:hypothetical protein